MKEGWFKDNYLILAENQNEAAQLTADYGIAPFLPGHSIVGLKSWDEFIVVDEKAQLFSVPTVPLEKSGLHPCELPTDSFTLAADERFKGKIKWYIKPLIFGGDPRAKENMAWIPMIQHPALVKYWNQLYRDLKQQQSKS